MLNILSVSRTSLICRICDMPLPSSGQVTADAAVLALLIAASALVVAKREYDAGQAARRADEDRHRRESEDRQRAADSRIGATAYALQCQIYSWLDGSRDLVDWSRVKWWETQPLGRAAVAERRFEWIMEQAPAASDGVSAAVVAAMVSFYNAMQAFQEAASLRIEDDYFDALTILRQPWKDLTACGEHLTIAIGNPIERQRLVDHERRQGEAEPLL